jgi:hypothetical protein
LCIFVLLFACGQYICVCTCTHVRTREGRRRRAWGVSPQPSLCLVGLLWLCIRSLLAIY